MPSTSLGPYSRFESPAAGLPIAGAIVKGAQQGAGSLPGGRIRRVVWTNKSASTAHYALIFCDPTNCGAVGAPTSTPGNPVVLPTSTVTAPSYASPLLPDNAGTAQFSGYTFDFGPDGIAAPGGIMVAASSTPNVYTALASADATCTVEYR
jgi:hypothetical protein